MRFLSSINNNDGADGQDGNALMTANELHCPQIHRQELLPLLGTYLQYVPFPECDAPRAAANYFGSNDYLSHARWVFVRQVSGDLLPTQLAKLLMGTVGVEPAVVVKAANQCMFVNMKSRSDMLKVLSLSRRLLLDHSGAWYATDSHGARVLGDHAKAFARRHITSSLPCACATFDVCTAFVRHLLSGAALLPKLDLPQDGSGSEVQQGHLELSRPHREALIRHRSDPARHYAGNRTVSGSCCSPFNMLTLPCVVLGIPVSSNNFT